jgi:hypothetical protein
MVQGTRVCAIAAALLVAAGPPARAQGHPGLSAIAPSSLGELRAWDARLQSMIRSGDLRTRQTREDLLVPGRTIERADQYYRGVRIFGADIARQLDHGLLISVFGDIYTGIGIQTDPTLSAEEARARIVALAGVEQGASRQPELVILPLDAGGYRLTWRMRAVTRAADVIQYSSTRAPGTSSCSTAIGRPRARSDARAACSATARRSASSRTRGGSSRATSCGPR